MRKAINKISICFALFLLTIFASPIVSADSKDTKQWTIMVYCDADNNLDAAGVNDLNELELSGSTEQINIVVLLDRYGWNDTHLYYVLHDPEGLPGGDDNNIISTIIDNQASSWLASEEDMGNPQTLQDFAVWTIQSYPAEHYLLSIWDHGSGIFKGIPQGITKGECWDDHGGVPGEYIDLAELRDVLAAMYAANGNQKIDIVGHDVCLLGQIETHYQMMPYVDIGIASEESEPPDGWDYEQPFIDLKNNPWMSPTNLATKIVDYYVDFYGPYASLNTQAAIDLQALGEILIPLVNDFALGLYDNMYSYQSVIINARANTEWYNDYYPENRELYHFSQLIQGSGSLPLSLRNSAQSLMGAYSSVVIAEGHGNYQPNAHGMTIWFPDNYNTHPDAALYQTKIEFSNEWWDEFLPMYDDPSPLPLFTELDAFGLGETYALAWGDCDEDGDLDLALSKTAPNPWPTAPPYDTGKVYINNHPASSFTEMASMPWGGRYPMTWGDYDNDGDADLGGLLLSHHPALCGIFLCRNEFYSNENSYPYVFTSYTLYPSSLDPPVDVAWGDYDNDGDLDIATANRWYHDRLFRNEGGDTFTESHLFATGESNAISWGDYDNDRDLDLAVCVNYWGYNNKLYRNEGSGNFTELYEFGMGITSDIEWGDYDNDGDLDLAVANHGQNKLYRNNGNGTFTGFDQFGADTSFNVAWGDYNNDGYLDLLVINKGGRNKLYENQGSGNFLELDLFNADTFDVAAWGDYDRDGDLDLAMGNDNYRDNNRLYRNNENSNDYLNVTLVGRRRGLSNSEYSNRDGIGAKVRVFDQSGVTLFGFREISSHGGAPLEAHFGVPEGNTYKLEVYWPTSGITMDTLVIAPAVITVWEYCRGDANGDKTIGLGDVVRLVNYLYRGGAAPDPLSSGDANGDGIVEMGDITYLHNYLYRGGPAPPPPNCP